MALEAEGKKESGFPETSKPFWFATQVAVRPVLTAATILVLSFIVAGTISSTWKLSDSHERDFLIADDERTERFDAIELAKASFDEGTVFPERSAKSDKLRIFLLFRARDHDNLLTSAHLKTIYDIEQEALNLQNYSTLCFAGEAGPLPGRACDPTSFLSITNLFNFSQRVPSDADISNAVVTEQSAGLTRLVLDKNFNNDSNVKSVWIRSMIEFGLPYKGFDSPKMEESEQLKQWDERYGTRFVEVFSEKEKAHDAVSVYHMGARSFDLDWQRVIQIDFFLAFGSIAFVFFYELVHMRSSFLAIAASLEVILAFPLTYCLYRYVFQITFFNLLHIMSIFILLGISADDVFVYFDAWNQAPLLFPALKNDLPRRVAWTYRRAAKAMLVTTSTTCAAFLATALSRIMPISAFGYWAAILVAVNFLYVVSLFPAMCVIRHVYLMDSHCWCCVCLPFCKKKHVSGGNGDIQQAESDEAKAEAEESSEVQEFRRIERFLVNHWLPNVFKLRYVIVVGSIAWMIVAIIYATKISPLTKQEEWLDSNHRLMIALSSVRSEFSLTSADFVIRVQFFWGVNPKPNREGTSKWKSHKFGKVVWDDNFDVTPEANQQHIFDFCTNLTNSNLILQGQVDCFMTDFANFVTIDLGRTFPVPAADFPSLLRSFSINSTQGVIHRGNNRFGLSNNRVRFIEIVGVSKQRPFEPSATLDPAFDQFDALIAETNAIATGKGLDGVSRAFQSAENVWAWTASEKEFFRSAFQGMLIALGTSFAALLLSTQNIILSLYATIVIAGITGSVLGVLKFQGAEFGTAESISVVLLIGLSVDYVVHLANSYMESHAATRYNRIRDALRDLGISIISGAITTLGSALFLWFAVGIFFTKFANIITFTILFSLYWALAFFVALCTIIGPEGEVGNLNKCFKSSK